MKEKLGPNFSEASRGQAVRAMGRPKPQCLKFIKKTFETGFCTVKFN